MRLISILLIALAGLTWLNWGKINGFIQQKLHPPAALKPDPETYAVLVGEISYHRNKLLVQYQSATHEAQREQVINSASELLNLLMPAMMKCWQGTPWDFNGTATIPGEGHIACGYFVSVIMRDAGFDVQRIKLAQQPSQNILRTFLPKKDLEIKVAKNYRKYMQAMRTKPDGIYIIGLDKHVGFIVKNQDNLEFIHSGGIHDKVINESEKSASSIRNSRYRVVGNLTQNKELIRKWLFNEPMPTHL